MGRDTDFNAYAEFLEITSPEIVKQFNEGYEDPVYPGGECSRCGVIVAGAHKHNRYHYALSLTLFVFGSTMQSITNLLEVEPEMEEDKQEIIPENNESDRL